jgi:large subunit ribosomal protein L5
MKSLLLERYQKEILPALMKELGLKNVMQVPKIEKIVVNVGMGSHLQKLGKKDGSQVLEAIEQITGQKAVVKKARLSVSNFKLREGMPVGVMTTLRADRAYNFLDKVINIVYPRVRGFQGVKSDIFDKNGNCSFGFKEHTVFPEVSVEDLRHTHGLQITIVFNTANTEHNKALMEKLGFPFQKKK